jgi:sporulation protein YlmC with PRC-barrel domain
LDVRYRHLVGKKVYLADGQRVGRVASLIAEAHGDRLRVTRIVVGPAGLLARIGIAVADGGVREVAWSDVAGFDGTITLREGAHARLVKKEAAE